MARATRFIIATGAGIIIASCGGDGGGGEGTVAPRFTVATRGEAEFSSGVYYCPDHLNFSVFLEPGGHGWVSMEHPAFGAKVVDVTWVEQGARYEITAPEVRVWGLFQEDPYYYVDVGWENLSFEARDEDGDGTAETGDASATLICDYEEFLSSETATWDASFDLGVDSLPASLAFDPDLGLEPIFAFADSMSVTSSRILLAEDLTDQIQLLVNGEPVSATVTPRDVAGPFTGGFIIDPVEAVPFDAALTIDAGALTDAFGAPVEFDGAALDTVSDPGPLTDNPSFEGEGGWIGLHTASANTAFPAVDGPTHAYLAYAYPQGDDLIGYFDVPSDATTFSVETGDYDYNWTCSYGSSSIALLTASGARDLFPSIPDTPDCDDFPYGCTIPWEKQTVSLVDLRGQRVVVHAMPATWTECRPDVFDQLVIDDVRIE